MASGNGLTAVGRAGEVLESGGGLLDAVVEGVALVEEDSADQTVGYGGLPNADGVVELDACVMHGPTGRAGAVAALRGVRTPSRVARLVLERTDDVLLVGEGAWHFARSQGFEHEELLTAEAREAWVRWKAGVREEDLPRRTDSGFRHEGTVVLLALDGKGDLAGATSTSGLPFKAPGRVGDTPLVGAGLYVENGVGAAGATGRGEAVILAGGARIVVENMRLGQPPDDAIRDVLERIVRGNRPPSLLDARSRPRFQVTFHALDWKGRFAAGALWSGERFAIRDGAGRRTQECFHLFERAP